MSPRPGINSRSVNGISSDDRSLIVDQLSDSRRVKEFSGPWTIQCSWVEGFKSRAEVRGHSIHFDQPGDIQADDTAPTPHEYLLSAVAGCLVAGVVMHATVQGIQLRSLDIEVSGTFDNVLKWAGLDDSGTPGYRAIEVRASISGNAADDVLRDIWDRTLAGSPVAQTANLPTPVISVLNIH